MLRSPAKKSASVPLIPTRSLQKCSPPLRAVCIALLNRDEVSSVSFTDGAVMQQNAMKTDPSPILWPLSWYAGPLQPICEVLHTRVDVMVASHLRRD
jgi:hypothetical protein